MSKVLIIGLIILSLAAIIGSYFILVSGQKPQVQIISYSASDKERPKVEAKTTFSNLGTMKVSEDRSANFKLKNIGQRNFLLVNLKSNNPGKRIS